MNLNILNFWSMCIMKTKRDRVVELQDKVIEQQERMIERLTKELAAREKHITDLYDKMHGTQQTYINVAEILKLQSDNNQTPQ